MTIQPMPRKTLRLVIHGRVQGVYFRDSMRREAQNLAVAGWVCNRSDGTVEAAVQGEPADVDIVEAAAACCASGFCGVGFEHDDVVYYFNHALSFGAPAAMS